MSDEIPIIHEGHEKKCPETPHSHSWNAPLGERKATETKRLDQASVDHPPHYQAPNGMEAIDIIEGFELGFNIGNAVKYLLRAGRKGDRATDIAKARWYCERELARLEKAPPT